MLRRLTGLILGIAFFFLLYFLPNPPGLSGSGQKVAAVSGLMAAWWITKTVNLAVTALIPLALFPILGILNMHQTASRHADPNIFLFMGGFMLATAFLSMWVSNTATTMMLVPIGRD